MVDIDIDEAGPDIVEMYTHNIKMMSALASAYDIPLVVMLQPTYHFGGGLADHLSSSRRDALRTKQPFHGKYFAPIYERMAGALTSLSKSGDFHFIDAKALLSESHPEGRLDAYYDYVHFTSAGHERLAHAFARVLKDELGLLDDVYKSQR